MIGLIFYFAIYIIYYFFLGILCEVITLKPVHGPNYIFNILKKISFSFSGPFPQGFSMNLLFYAGSIFSQDILCACFLIWLGHYV